ncbi:MAG: site-specific DNA-methyltransferase [Armatimonadota bacterium]|nr:site-specific DNA-methyltransferase [Armatimonadota bacterium]
MIDYIAAFEDELVKIWNKPKFVLNSNYVITLDRIVAQDGGWAVLEKILEHPNFEQQLQEWRDLGMIDETFAPAQLVGQNLIDGRRLNPRYQYLPIDTRYFKDLEPQILALFDNLDESLDGWLIKSENYQALNTILPKWRGKVQCVYIDPPYNSPSSEIPYLNRYGHSTWMSMMHNRLELSKKPLNEDFVYIIAIDDHERVRLLYLVHQVLDYASVVPVTVVHNQRGQQGKNFSCVHEYAYFIYPNDENKYVSDRERDEVDYRNLRDSGSYSRRSDAKNCFYPIFVKNGEILSFGEVCDDEFHPPAANVEVGDGVIAVYPIDTDGCERKWRYARQSIEAIKEYLQVVETQHGLQIYLKKNVSATQTVWYGSRYDASEYGTKVLQDILSREAAKQFKFPKSVHLVEDAILACIPANKEGSFILDFFAGSGTTAHAVMNLNRQDGGRRRFILVEMADYFYSVLLPRVKKVAFSDKWRSGKAQPDGKGIGCFVKYYELE